MNNDLERRACAAILHAADDDTPIPPQIMAEIESMTPERREAVAQAAARVMTDRQALVEVHETLNEMIADGEVTREDRSGDGRGQLPARIAVKEEMSMSIPYASATTGQKAREEISKILRRLGCESIGFMDDFQSHEVLLAFSHRGRQVQLRASARGWRNCT